MATKKFYLAACCILKDEDPFLSEWFIYHSLIGVEHFFVYDNLSATPVEHNPVVQKLVAQGRATVAPIAGKPMQLPAYAHCLQTYGQFCQWLAFIDLDEFICPSTANDIRPLLADYTDYAALVLNWKCFGSSGHIMRPEGLVINNYQERFLKEHRLHFHIKSIVQPHKTANVNTAHAFYPHHNEVAVNENFRPQPFAASLTPVSWQKACINHYIIKSQEDAEHRMRRGRADIKSDKPTIDKNDLAVMQKEPQEHDDIITRFAATVEEYVNAATPPLTTTDHLKGADISKYTRLAELMAHEQRYTEAELMLCHASLHHAENPALWVTWAKLASLQGQYERAVAMAKKSLRFGALLQSYEELLEAYIKLGQYNNARPVLNFLKLSIKNMPQTPELVKKFKEADKILSTQVR